MIPKIKKTKKQSRRTLPNIGSVSSNSITRILMPIVKKNPIKETLTEFVETTWYSVDGSQRS